uniref:Uncharacterized protein n=1 Tax=Rhizophora mucronata TaxID=61149 RepID=A0A2P2P1E5_RHIMU
METKNLVVMNLWILFLQRLTS